MLQVEELFDLIEPFKNAIIEKAEFILSKLNREGILEEVMTMMGIESDLYPDQVYSVPKAGKIVVIGQSEVKPKVFVAIAEELGISRDRFEFCLDYQDCKRYNFKKLRYSTDYSAVMVGPMPHSSSAKGNYSSAITAMETDGGYPPVIRLGSNGLKITRSDFKEKLKMMVNKHLVLGTVAVYA